METAIRKGDIITKTILKLENVSKMISKRKILDNISMEINNGDIMALIGPNGAGKTTLMKLIVGLSKLSSGAVFIDNYDIKHKVNGQVGYIIENPCFYDYLTGYQNLVLRAKIVGISEDRLLEVVKFSGLEKRINDKVKCYSLGMKQRLGLAMAILDKPKLLLLDEPMNGLDPLGVENLKDMIKDLVKHHDMAVLISSHNLLELNNFCNKVCVINKGKKIYCGEIDTSVKDIFMKRVDNYD